MTMSDDGYSSPAPEYSQVCPPICPLELCYTWDLVMHFVYQNPPVPLWTAIDTSGYLKGPQTPFKLIMAWSLDTWWLLIALIPVVHRWLWSLEVYHHWLPWIWVWVQAPSHLLHSIPEDRGMVGSQMDPRCTQGSLKGTLPWNWNFLPDLTSQPEKAPLLPVPMAPRNLWVTVYHVLISFVPTAMIKGE